MSKEQKVKKESKKPALKNLKEKKKEKEEKKKLKEKEKEKGIK